MELYLYNISIYLLAITILGNCLNVFQGKLFHDNCTRFQFGCPDTYYWRYEAYKCKKNIFNFDFFVKYNVHVYIFILLILSTDPACLYIDTVRQCYILDPSCVSREPWNTSNHYCKKNSGNENKACNTDKDIDFLPSVLGAFFSIVIFGFIWLACYIWNKQNPLKGMWTHSLQNV